MTVPDDNGADRRLFPLVRSFLERSGWDVDARPEQSILRTVAEGDAGRWECYARTREAEEQIVFYSVGPRHAPEPTRAATAELLTRINYGLIIGNFEFDYSDGEVRYKTSIDVEGEPLTDAQLGKLTSFNVHAMDHYLSFIDAVMDGAMTPSEAMQQVDAA